MHRSKLITISLFIFLVLKMPSYAQNHIRDNTTIDSLRFAETRNKINMLDNSSFEKHLFQDNGKKLPYRILLPKGYEKTKKYPLVLTFHNSSRIGNDNEQQLEHLAKIWIREEIYNTYNAIVIAPQFEERSSCYTDYSNGILISKPYADINLVFQLLENIEKQYNIDQNRIYLVGYSMGASTAQNIAALKPSKFAALVSIAAVPDFSNLKSFKRKSILLIHGKTDIDNPYNGSEALFERLTNNKKLIFKTYNNLNHHNITIPFLLTDEIPKWLFQQEK